MNSIWNKNISLFTNRFPQLAQLLLPAISSFSEASIVFSDIAPAKNGSVTASENSLRLHSAYNPEREAQSAVSSAVAGNAVSYSGVWFITETTGSPIALAVMYVLAFLPMGLLAPLGGVLADRHSRKKIIITCDALMALTLAICLCVIKKQ